MIQYLSLLEDVINKGVIKESVRDNMPYTKSIFGRSISFDLSKGFPIITTNHIDFHNIIFKLIWFMKGDTNIKFLVDNNCNIWNEYAYNYYVKMIHFFNKDSQTPPFSLLVDDPNQNCTRKLTFNEFIDNIKEGRIYSYGNYRLGDCGNQYGKLWRNWLSFKSTNVLQVNGYKVYEQKHVDQLKGLLYNLKSNPLSRRHILTSWDPTTLDGITLNACNVLVQFNCRPIPWDVKLEIAKNKIDIPLENLAITEAASGNTSFGYVPQYYLDCLLYQRSADLFLGVPYSITLYSLFTSILCKFLNMLPGQFINNFGDTYIYGNHEEQIQEQLKREVKELPKLCFSEEFENMVLNVNKVFNSSNDSLDEMIDLFLGSINLWDQSLFYLENYRHHKPIND